MYYNTTIDFKPEEVIDYLRKSRSDDPDLSVDEVLQRHETILDEWARKHLGAVVPEENKFREVVSGETIKDRPEIQKVLELIESPKYKAIFVVEVQRLSRGDLEDAGRLIKLLRYTNTKVITPHKTYDLRDEYDRDAFERELKRGNEFLEYQKKIMSRGRELSVKQGNYIGSVPPYGYDKIAIKDGKRTCHTLKENKVEADAVRLMFDLYVNKNMGTALIARHLDEIGVKPRKGEKWSPDAINDMLSNVHYIGKVKWNWRKVMNIVEDGEIVKTRPKNQMSEFLICEGKHEGIVSEELFNAAQERKGKNPRNKPSTKIRNPFAGLVYCHCGRAMTMRTYKKDGVERSAPRLLCDNQVHCKTGSCQFDEMMERVVSVLKECIEDFEVRLTTDDGESKMLHLKMIANLEKRLDELNKKEIAQWEKYSMEGMPKHIFETLNEKVLAEKAETLEALCKAKECIPDPVDYEERIVRFSEALEALRDPDVPPILKNRLLKSCIEKIVYKREAPKRAKDVKGGKGKGIGAGQWISAKIELDIYLKN